MSRSSLFTLQSSGSFVPLEQRTGKLAFTLTNDYLFKVVHYYMMEEHSHSIYTPKFRLSILDLTQAALATNADRQQGLDLWAAAFRATTWEEFQMLAEKDTLFKTVSDALYIVLENKDLADQIRRQWEYEAIEKHRKEQEQRRKEREKRMIEKEKQMIEKEKQMVEKEKRMIEKQKHMEEDQKRMEEDQKRMTAEINTLRLELEKAKSALAENNKS